jgi:uncharacterized protein YbjT (DUF2867 family)
MRALVTGANGLVGGYLVESPLRVIAHRVSTRPRPIGAGVEALPALSGSLAATRGSFVPDTVQGPRRYC